MTPKQTLITGIIGCVLAPATLSACSSEDIDTVSSLISRLIPSTDSAEAISSDNVPNSCINTNIPSYIPTTAETTGFNGALSEYDMKVIVHSACPNGGIYERLPLRYATDPVSNVDYYYYRNSLVALSYDEQGRTTGYMIGQDGNPGF